MFSFGLKTHGIPTVFQTHRKTVLNHQGWVHLPSKDLAMETALCCVNMEGIPNEIMPEAFGSMVMEHCTEAVDTGSLAEQLCAIVLFYSDAHFTPWILIILTSNQIIP